MTAEDVSPLMRLMKEARLCESPRHGDSFTDLIGYTLTGAEVNGVDPASVDPSLDVADAPAKPQPLKSLYDYTSEDDAVGRVFRIVGFDASRHQHVYGNEPIEKHPSWVNGNYVLLDDTNPVRFTVFKVIDDASRLASNYGESFKGSSKARMLLVEPA